MIKDYNINQEPITIKRALLSVYDKTEIKELALKEKQLTAIQKWMNEKIIDTYISVNDQNKQCNFANKWLKN